MYLKVQGELREVIIEKKRTTKNTYMRVKEDGKIYVTTNAFTSDKKIMSILEEHLKDIEKMATIQEKKKDYQERFFYLGKEYEPVRMPGNEVRLGEVKVFIGDKVDLSKWYKKEAEVLFKERLDFWYKNFSYTIPYPKLRLRFMKSRWGVCNVKDKVITLNVELMKKMPYCLDYVIVHELSHLIEANHSARFWKVVEENYPNYKKVKKVLKDYE